MCIHHFINGCVLFISGHINPIYFDFQYTSKFAPQFHILSHSYSSNCYKFDRIDRRSMLLEKFTILNK